MAATMMLMIQRIQSTPPVCWTPSSPAIHHPISAPTMPMMVVMSRLMFWRPGTKNRARSPTMRPAMRVGLTARIHG